MDPSNPLLAGRAAFADRYELLSELGVGGFGAVYKARQLTTGQPVALKIMRFPEQGGAARLERRIARFLRETQLCAQLHHPNIVQLVDAGRAGEELLYTVFSFVPGETLADVLAREGALTPREARHLMLQVLDALACAHQQGVIHRDLKPRNIMVLPSGARRNAVVLDFGIGAIAGAGGEQHPRLTGTDEALGTVGYAAPEQLRGLEPTPRVDLFSWGLVYLECLTGTPVFAGSSMAEILYAQLSPDPVPIPPALEGHWLGGLLRHVTEKNPAARDARAAALVAALEACDLGELSREMMVGGAPFAGSASGGPGPVHGFFAPTAVAQPGSIPQPTAEGERRQVTAVCCAIEVLDGAPRPLDVEEADELLRAQIRRCTEIARGYRGHVAAALGDRVLIYFGYPRADEDDARRAARAALEIAAAAQAEGEQFAARGIRLAARLGVHTGVLVAQDLRAHAGLSLGATPRAAARLAALAQPGEVAVSVEAQRLLRSAFELERGGPRRAEGDSAPGEVFLLRSERGDQPTPDADGRGAPLCGREQEMAILLERWRRTRAGAGQCTLITGEPGIGKSRLARELRARVANDPHTFLELRCAPDTQHSVLFPVVEMLGRALGLDQEASPERRIARIEARLSGHGFTPAEVMPLFLPLFSLPMAPPYAPLEVSPERLKELTLNAVLSLLFGMAEERPLILVAEDLHWSDTTTLELLAQLVQEAPSVPVSVIMTARPEFSPPFSTTGVQQVPLSRLERAHMEAMVTALLGGKSLPAEVIDQVVDRTDGVPLFVEELTRMMVESGVLVERVDRYELAGSLSNVEIPSTLRALLTARLDRLGRAKETAQLAAALGREFSVEVLVAVSPAEAAAVQEDLDRLMGAGLVFRKRRVRESAYVFKHALVRDAAYESLSRAAQRQVHARIALTMEERFPIIVEARPDLLSQHHAKAEQKREAIGYARQAAQRAFERSAHVDAVRQAEEAIGWVDAIVDVSEREKIELDLCSLMLFILVANSPLGAPALARIAQRTLELVERHGDDENAAPTLWRLLLYYMHVRADKAGTIASQLLRLIERTQDVIQEAALLSLFGFCRWVEGRFDEARAHLDRILVLYNPQFHIKSAFNYGLDPKVSAHSLLAGVMSVMGYPDQALSHAQAAVAWANEVDHPVSMSNALLYLTTVHYIRKDHQRVAETTALLMNDSDRRGRGVEVFCGLYRAWATNDLEAARRCISAARASGEKLGMTYWSALVADIEAAHGNYAIALNHIKESQQLAAETGECYFVSEINRLKGIYLMACDTIEEATAEKCFRNAIEVARRQGAKTLELRASVTLGSILRDRGFPDAARALVQPIYEWFTEGHELNDMKMARDLLKQCEIGVPTSKSAISETRRVKCSP
ncbi:TOMM system kinase/cyclase fusion protein [Sorangium sp. So ce134]